MSDITTGTTNPKTITVKISNLEATGAVHVYFAKEQPSSSNLVNPQSSIKSKILAHRIGYIVSVYVDDAENPEGVALSPTNVEVTAMFFNSKTAELH